MKTILFCLMFFFSVSLHAANIQTQLQLLMNQSANRWNQGDLHSFLTLYKKSDNTIYISNTITKGYDSIRQRYLQKYSNRMQMGQVQFKINDIKMLSTHYIFVIGEWHLERKNLSSLSGVFTLLFEKVNNQWKVIVDHTS